MLSDFLAARIDRAARSTLGQQLYDAIRQLILDATLVPGQRLPSSRQLAGDLALARNTVTDAYAQLFAEGYLESRVGAGSFVARTLPETRMHAAPPAEREIDAALGGTALADTARNDACPAEVQARRAACDIGEGRPPHRTAGYISVDHPPHHAAGEIDVALCRPCGVSVAGSTARDAADAACDEVVDPAVAAGPATLSRRAAAVEGEPAIVEGGSFAPCVPELSTFPFPIWQRLLTRAWREVRARDVRYAEPGGHPALRAAVAEHVALTRQVRCHASQVVIVNGAQHGLDLCARLLADAGDRVWVEDPGYPGARRVFRAADLALVPMPVDAQGMAPRPEQWRRAPRLIYITPSHQFPTGVVMSLRRRRALLAEAARHGSWIIEDDYDGEFRFGGRPLASLQGIDAGQRVIYLGTFSKAMFPGLRLAYLVLPASIAARFAAVAAQLSFEGRQVEQAALAAFLREGHFAAHVRRMRLLYGARRDAFAAAWRAELGALAPLSGGDTGMHMIAQLPLGSDGAIATAAREIGVAAQSLESLFLGPPDRAGLVLGYGAVDEPRITRDAAALARLVRRALAARAGERADEPIEPPS